METRGDEDVDGWMISSEFELILNVLATTNCENQKAKAKSAKSEGKKERSHTCSFLYSTLPI